MLLSRHTRRREFITLLGGAAAWPVAARGQQAVMPVVGFLHSAPSTSAHLIAAFHRGLAETGHVPGRNVAIEYRWAEGQIDQLPELAADLISRRVAVIATPGSQPAALAAKAATAATPIVFGIAEDPVKLGLVASLGRPGGNVTGINFFTAELGAKRLALLHELIPGASRVGVLLNPADATRAESTLRDVETAARAIGLQIHVVRARTGREIDMAFADIVRERCDVLFVGPDPLFYNRRVQLATLAARFAIPATYAVRDYTEAGGLMSYGTDLVDMFRQVGVYTGRILKGTKAADLPVEQSIKFELVINLNTVRALGLEVPATLLARADEVIE
jgi:putative tryptophan/tyrosine transport system substrate-binding protein